jgi:hypothetical protein
VPEPAGARWRVSPGLVAVKLAGAVIFAMVAVVTALTGVDRVGVVVAGLAAVGLGGYALRDVVAPVRVEADADGVTVVTGFARRLRLPWSTVERVRVDVRSRYGLRSEHLEIDAGESVHLFSAAELSAPVADVAVTLNSLRASASP